MMVCALSSRRPIYRSCLTVSVLTVVVSTAFAQNWTADWHTFDGGGELQSQTGDGTWQLSGTIGQPDGTAADALSGNGWTLTGGFWPVDAEARTEVLFQDSFEAPGGGLAGNRQ